MSTREEHYGNNWQLSEGYRFLGSFLTTKSDQTRVYDMYALVGENSAHNSVSFCVRWGEGITDACDGYAQMDVNGYWDVSGNEHIHYAALQYFANYHLAYTGNNSILPYGTVKTPKETVQ